MYNYIHQHLERTIFESQLYLLRPPDIEEKGSNHVQADFVNFMTQILCIIFYTIFVGR